MLLKAISKAPTQGAEIRLGKISGWGEKESLYNVELIGGNTLYNVAGPEGLSLQNWVTVSTDGTGKNSILNKTRYDSTEIVEVEV